MAQSITRIMPSGSTTGYFNVATTGYVTLHANSAGAGVFDEVVITVTAASAADNLRLSKDGGSNYVRLDVLATTAGFSQGAGAVFKTTVANGDTLSLAAGTSQVFVDAYVNRITN